jgi:hypothetical protein
LREQRMRRSGLVTQLDPVHASIERSADRSEQIAAAAGWLGNQMQLVETCGRCQERFPPLV